MAREFLLHRASLGYGFDETRLKTEGFRSSPCKKTSRAV